MSKIMTPKQRKALAFIATLASGAVNGYHLKVCGYGNTGTLQQLQDRGYVRAVGNGHCAFPSNAQWRITEKGKRAVKMGDAA